MKEYEKVKIAALDPTGCNGTIASVLLDPNINQAHYAEVLYYLLHKTLDEKSYFERTTNAMMKVMLDKALNKELAECLELKE